MTSSGPQLSACTLGLTTGNSGSAEAVCGSCSSYQMVVAGQGDTRHLTASTLVRASQHLAGVATMCLSPLAQLAVLYDVAAPAV
jgi:hypothetical protein